MTDQTLGQYTLVDEKTGEPLAVISASTPEAAKMYEGEGIKVLPGVFNKTFRLEKGKMVKRGYPMSYIRPLLSQRIEQQADVKAHGMYEPLGIVLDVSTLIRILLMAVADGNTTGLEGISSHLNEIEDKKQYELERVKEAAKPSDIKDLLKAYWPEAL